MSYSNIKLTESPSYFSWDYPFEDGGFVLSDINDLTAAKAGISVSMPAANNTFIGKSVTFNNIGSFAIDIVSYDGASHVITLPVGSVATVYLIKNDTAMGEWRAIQLAGGSIGIPHIDIKTTGSVLKVTGSPVESGIAGSIQIDTNKALNSFGSLQSQGIVFSADTSGEKIITRTFVSGNGININNPDGINGPILVELTNSISKISDLSVGQLKFTEFTITRVGDGDITIQSSGKNSKLNLNNITIDTNGILETNKIIIGGLTFEESNITSENDINIKKIKADNIVVSDTIHAKTITLDNPYISPGGVSSQAFFSDNNTLTTTPQGNMISIRNQVNIFNIVGANGRYTVSFEQFYVDSDYIIQLTLSHTTDFIPPVTAFFADKTTTGFTIITVDLRGNLIPVTGGICLSVWGKLKT